MNRIVNGIEVEMTEQEIAELEASRIVEPVEVQLSEAQRLVMALGARLGLSDADLSALIEGA